MILRDDEILETVTRKGRMVLAEQVARVWWRDQKHGRANAERRLRRLVAVGSLVEFRVFAQPVMTLASPLVAWRPAGPIPDFMGLSRQLFRRSRQVARRVSIFVPTPRTLAQLGCPPRPFITNDCQVSHDIHVTEVYLRYRVVHPVFAAEWIGEDLISHGGDHFHPDALLVDRSGRPYRAIEFGGRYTVERLARFHDGCAIKGLPYEVW